MTLTIEITSDSICPWCLIANARLNQAIAQLKTPVKIKRIWYPEELNSTMSETCMDRTTYRSNKIGSWEYSQMLDA